MLLAAGFAETAPGVLELSGDDYGPTSQAGAYLGLVISLLHGPALSAGSRGNISSGTSSSSANGDGEGKMSYSGGNVPLPAVGPKAFAVALKRLRAGAFDEDCRVAIPLLMKIIRKAVLSPPGHKHRSIKVVNEVFKWRLGRFVSYTRFCYDTSYLFLGRF